MVNPLKAEFAPGDTYPNPYWAAFMGPGKPAPPDYPPYAWWEYSNSNYTLLGLIAEKVSGMPLQDAIERIICRRLGLADTALAIDLKQPANMMRGYTRLDALRNPKYAEWKDVTGVNPSYAWAAGAVISTPWDLLHFVDRIFRSSALLNKGTRQKWLTFVSADIHWPDMEYGMGGLMQGHRAYGDLRGHGGAYPGYKTVMYHFPDSDTLLIIASNTWDGQAEVEMMDTIMALAAAAPSEPRVAATPAGARLEWQPGRTYGDSYTVFWGSRPEAVEAGLPDVDRKDTANPRATISGLAPEATYYWRVETVSRDAGRITGPLWRFRTAKRAH
jgi:CubicO group peptidase (beta-lactamase class C family)